MEIPEQLATFALAPDYELVDQNVDKSAYGLGRCAWPSKCISDVVYIPRLPQLPPVLIEIQCKMDEDFTRRLINYSLQLKQEYGHLPKVLQFVDRCIWREFKIYSVDDVPYVQQLDYNLMLTINMDWFQLYSNSAFSCGGIYLTIQNLKRDVLCVLLPSLGEPDRVPIQTRHHRIVTVKAALTMVACDLPSARKVSIANFKTAYIIESSHNQAGATEAETFLKATQQLVTRWEERSLKSPMNLANQNRALS
ncbi:hypothetical protein INT47_012791 [Mucor saturninus]|uniref:Uncharacterized protein n=1 Tax=Mucor saturninus TaxID=64648 RepID=A0A8H7QQ96_9FUNG|nr:hypothetical protein INT47_012791 [Mucor saturninus]